jgi:hypothetical protein
MIDNILIMNEAGLLLFNWEHDKTISKDGDLISGFLTALNLFAKGQRGEELKKIDLDPTTFIFERQDGLIFAILTTDPNYEKIIFSIIIDIKNRFLELFRESAQNFAGAIAQFRPFQQEIENILNSYAYYDYLRIKDSFDSNESLKSVLHIDKTKGEVLYVRSKVYIERGPLTFQSGVLLKSINRLFSDVLNENILMTIVIDSSKRCLFFRDAGKITEVKEIQNENEGAMKIFSFKDKKIAKILKTPQRILSEIDDRLIFIDERGELILKRNLEISFPIEKITSDCITINNCSESVITDIYKNILFSTLILTERNLYNIFPIKKNVVFMQWNFKQEDFEKIKELWINLKNIGYLVDNEFNEIQNNLFRVNNIKKHFL